MSGEAWASIASEGSSIISTALNWIASSSENKKAREFDKSMAEYAYNKNLEMWQMENAYNSPAAQMARLEEAGLNPALMYQQGNTGNAGSMPAYANVTGQFNTGPKDLSIDFQKIMTDRLNIDRMKKMNELLDQQIDAQFWDTMRKNFDFGLDYGNPNEVHIIKSRSGRDYSYSNPGYQSDDGYLFGPKKFYDLSATAADASSAWHKNAYNQQLAIREKNSNSLFDWNRRSAQAEATIKEATARWLEMREKDWTENKMFADKLSAFQWFDYNMAEASKTGALTVGSIQKLLEIAGQLGSAGLKIPK